MATISAGSGFGNYSERNKAVGISLDMGGLSVCAVIKNNVFFLQPGGCGDNRRPRDAGD
jgi:hypothetical protein